MSKRADPTPRWWQSAAGLRYRLELLDHGCRVGLVDNVDGAIVCDWPVTNRQKEVKMPRKTRPKKPAHRYSGTKGERLIHSKKAKAKAKNRRKYA